MTTLVIITGWGARAVVAILALLLFWSLTLLLGKLRLLRTGAIAAGALRVVRESSSFERRQGALECYFAGWRRRLDRGLPWLSAAGANAPLLGLLGTTLAIIEGFGLVALTATAGLLFAMLQALTAVLLGLLVIVPALIADHIVTPRIRRTLAEAERLAALL